MCQQPGSEKGKKEEKKKGKTNHVMKEGWAQRLEEWGLELGHDVARGRRGEGGTDRAGGGGGSAVWLMHGRDCAPPAGEPAGWSIGVEH